jgi:hypothetical protein
MHCAGHFALALQLPHVADINQHHIVSAGQAERLIDWNCLDLAHGGINQGAVSSGNRRWHCRTLADGLFALKRAAGHHPAGA